MKEKRSGSIDSFYDTFDSPLGKLFLIFSGKKLSGIDFKKPADIPRKGKAPDVIKNELEEYFEHGKDTFAMEIDLTRGTEFDHRVWLTLKEIPFGETKTYKWLAERIGKPNASRAVGQALGRNPIPILLPCHRIIESDGSLGGFSGGVDMKRRLLEKEYYIKMGKKE
jgi:methylated-DNA-[protein]-cysteine S-methyltransferase